jgi:hypothetical protein
VVIHFVKNVSKNGGDKMETIPNALFVEKELERSLQIKLWMGFLKNSSAFCLLMKRKILGLQSSRNGYYWKVPFTFPLKMIMMMKPPMMMIQTLIPMLTKMMALET